MGYEARRTFKLVFPDLEGLEVRAKSVPMDVYLKLNSMHGSGLETTEVMLQRFQECLVDWNVTDDGEPVPTTLEGVKSVEPELIMAIVDAWMDAINGVSAPLAKPSSDGEPSLEASIPMESLTQSQEDPPPSESLVS